MDMVGFLHEHVLMVGSMRLDPSPREELGQPARNL